jgi:ATP-binding cassette, subfamily B, bacterial MsbA
MTGLLRYYRRYSWWVALAVFTVPIFGVTSTAVVALIEPVLTDVLLTAPSSAAPALSSGPELPQDLPGAPGRAGLKAMADRAYRAGKAAAGVTEHSVVFFTPLLLFGVFVVRGAADFWGAYAFQRIGLGIATDIRSDLYRRVLEQDARFHADHPSGELASRVINDMSLVQSALSSRLFDVAQQSVTLVLLVLLLLSTDFTLAVIVLTSGPVFVFVLARFGRSARKASRRGQQRIADATSVLLEGVHGHPVVKAFGGERHEHARFRAAIARYLSASLRGQQLSLLSSVVVEILAVGTTSAFLVYAGLRIRSGSLSAVLLIQFLANVWLLYEPVRKLNGANMALQPLVAVWHRVRDLQAIPVSVSERPDAVALDGFRDRIVVEGVTVRYAGRPAVKDVSFEIRRGEVVALVGVSGGGKTTLASLLPRFFDPDEGRVTIDGHDLRDLTIASLRSHVGIVTQHTHLFDETIRHNIAYAQPDAPAEAVEQAARAACAEEFILAKPGGFDAHIGESGVRLSGGERQRLAIARAILKNAPILVLDEATSQLDSESEAVVHRALHNLMTGRTVLVVAHRLSTVQQADRIVVMDRGVVVESGRHAELLANGGTYRRLFERWRAAEHE